MAVCFIRCLTNYWEIFPLKAWLMLSYPLSNGQLSEKENIFHYHVSRDTGTIEKMFGKLLATWCLPNIFFPISSFWSRFSQFFCYFSRFFGKLFDCFQSSFEKFNQISTYKFRNFRSNFKIRRFLDKKMGDLSRFDTCIITNKKSKMLTQRNCIDNSLHIILKQNMDITARKIANVHSLLELYQTWLGCNKDLQSCRMVHKSKELFNF